LWSSTSITNPQSDEKVTIQCAINEWNHHVRRSTRLESSSYPVRYFDHCVGAICNPQCPESILLGVLGDIWPDLGYLIVTMVLAVTTTSLVYMVLMVWKKRLLFHSYQDFLNDFANTVSWLYIDMFLTCYLVARALLTLSCGGAIEMTYSDSL
jgi:hypothetical protein